MTVFQQAAGRKEPAAAAGSSMRLYLHMKLCCYCSCNSRHGLLQAFKSHKCCHTLCATILLGVEFVFNVLLYDLTFYCMVLAGCIWCLYLVFVYLFVYLVFVCVWYVGQGHRP